MFQGYLMSADRRRRGQGLLLTLWETPLQAEIAIDTLAELEPTLRPLGLKMDEAPQIQEVLGRPSLLV